MAEQTGISWAEATHNPWIGCTKVSPACDGCYAAHLMETRLGRVIWGGPGRGAGTRVQTSAANRRKPLAWNKHPEKLGPPPGTKPFVFSLSLGDIGDVEIPLEWLAESFEIAEQTPNLQWLFLTKRPQLVARRWFKAAGSRPWPSNVALGTTVEDRARLGNLDWLLQASADILRDGGTAPTFLFGSFEPLLEELGDIGPWLRAGLGWAITGGETDQGDHQARPAHIRAYRSIRDQSAAAGVPYQHKQWGEWLPGEVYRKGNHGGFARHQDGTDMAHGGKRDHWWEGDTFGGIISTRVGKKLSGRLLDGVEHNARPFVPAVAA
jgi:protein gp37